MKLLLILQRTYMAIILFQGINKNVVEKRKGINMERKEFIKSMKTCRKTFERAIEREAKIFEEMEDAFPELNLNNCVTFAENSDNIQDAISCYLQYGEYSPEKIWEDLVLAKKTIDTLPTEEAKKCFGKR